MEFVEGARVIVTLKGSRLSGLQGTVCHVRTRDSIGVRFDDHIDGHGCRGHCHAGHGYYLPARRLIVIELENE